MTDHHLDVDREDLHRSARELIDLLPDLVALVPEQATALESEPGLTGTKRLVAPAPWNPAAAMAFYEIHGDARRYESLLTLRLFGRAQYRGGSGRDTVECVRRLPLLVEHGRAERLDDLDLVDVTAALVAWPKRVRVLLGQERPGDARPTPVPGGAVCPQCDRGLVLSSGWRALAEHASAECPSCRDDDGRPARWPVKDLLGQAEHEELLTVDEAHARLGVAPNTLYSWKRRGRIHPHGQDTRGKRTYRASDIRALLEANTDEQDASARRAHVRELLGLPASS